MSLKSHARFCVVNILQVNIRTCGHSGQSGDLCITKFCRRWVGTLSNKIAIGE